jgi:PAS domain-containing protein
MHFAGMATATFDALTRTRRRTWAIASLVAAASLASPSSRSWSLVAASIMSVVDRRFLAQSRELQTTEARYRSLFDRCLAGVYQTTTDGRLIDCNEAFARPARLRSREACMPKR